MPKTVLAIDDDPGILSATETILQEKGYETISANNGEEALRILKKKTPHIVILDILMPKESGVKLYQILRTDEALKDVPVVIHSGISRRTFLRSQEALQAFGNNPVPEPDAYLEKPIDPLDLLRTIEDLIG